jgi:two-component sensor histidine kinase
MQVIAALAEVQAANPETSAQAALQRIGHHVRTLALLNDMLTRELRDGKEVTAISAKDVLEELIVYLQSSLEHHVVNYAVDDVELPLAQSATVALLTSELISNATKHGGREIEVRLWREDKDIKLEVRDNGPGFPPDFDPETATSTGMEIIKSVARWDLRGDIGFHSLPGGGACVRVVWSARRKA